MDLILESGSEKFLKILNDSSHEVQVIYGQINGGSIKHFDHGEMDQYFYPASSVKMIAAFAAVKKLQELNLPLDTEIIVDSTEHHPRVLNYDSLYESQITIENLLKKIFVFSDNQAYNILYGWLGKEYINALQAEILLPSRIQHQLSESAFSFDSKANASRTSTLLMSEGDTVKSNADMVVWESELSPSNQQKGLGYLDADGLLVSQPFDFSQKNYLPLSSLLGSLERVVLPEMFEKTYDLNENYRSELIKIMSLLPSDLPDPISTLGDNYVKFFLYGDGQKSQPESITIHNKIGLAYGYLIDVAFIQDNENDIQFFLAASIHVNENQIYNDGVYEYDEVGIPFLTELGQMVYQYELDRNNK